MFTLADVYAAAGQPPPAAAGAVEMRGAHFDSRRMRAGWLFTAMPGARVDGADYIADAFGRGAAGVLAERADPSQPLWRQVIVPEALAAFQALARGIRRRGAATVVGVTGSNGKTTTKQAVAAALRAHAPTLATDRSENTDVGVPATLSRLDAADRFAVIEMGAQIRGEIASYCRVAEPDAAVITNISGAHLGLFGSLEAIVEAKSELLAALPPGAPAALPADDRRLPELRARVSGPVTTFGRSPQADVVVAGELSSRGTTVTIQAGGISAAVEAPNLAGPIDLAFGAAAAAALGLGLELTATLDGLREFEPAPHRMALRSTPDGATLLDDSYNANAASMLAALAALRRLPVRGRRLAVLGDMLELGEASTAAHREVGRAAAQLDALLAIGAAAGEIVEGARSAGMPAARTRLFAAELADAGQLAAARAELEQWLRGELAPGDALLLKASNGIGLGPLADALAADAGAGA